MKYQAKLRLDGTIQVETVVTSSRTGLDMGSLPIYNVQNPVSGADAVNLSYLQSYVSSSVPIASILTSGSGLSGDVITTKLVFGTNLTGSNAGGIVTISSAEQQIPTGSIILSGSGITGNVIINKFVLGTNLTGSNSNGTTTLTCVIPPVTIPTGSIITTISAIDIVTNKILFGTNITGSNNNGTVTISSVPQIATGSILTNISATDIVTNKLLFGTNITGSNTNGVVTISSVGPQIPTGSIIVSASNMSNVVTNKLIINNGLTGSNNNGTVTISQALNLTELFGESTTQLLTLDSSTPIYSASFVFGASKFYTCPVGFRSIIWISGSLANCGSLDSVVDAYVATNGSGVPTFVFQRTPLIDNSRLVSTLTGSTMTISGSTGGFTISVTRQSGSACYAKAKWWISKLEELV